MTNEGQRTEVEAQDWPLEETTADENSTGLRSDIGVSSQDRREGELERNDAGLDGGRGETGQTTPGERGTDQAPR